MEVYERIKEILNKKHISKAEFVNKLIETEVKLKTTGEIPSRSTLYSFFNGTREIPLELIVPISRILNIKVQDLFEDNDIGDDEKDKIIELIHYAPNKLIKIFINILLDYKATYSKNLKKLK